MLSFNNTDHFVVEFREKISGNKYHVFENDLEEVDYQITDHHHFDKI